MFGHHLPPSPDDALLQNIPVDMLDAFLAMDDGAFHTGISDRALSSGMPHELGSGTPPSVASENGSVGPGPANTDNA